MSLPEWTDSLTDPSINLFVENVQALNTPISALNYLFDQIESIDIESEYDIVCQYGFAIDEILSKYNEQRHVVLVEVVIDYTEYGLNIRSIESSFREHLKWKIDSEIPRCYFKLDNNHSLHFVNDSRKPGFNYIYDINGEIRVLGFINFAHIEGFFLQDNN